MVELGDRRRNLVATLGFLQVKPTEPELRVGLHRVGYDLALIQQADEGWNATFYITGRMHSIVGGWVHDPKPWRAVQRAGGTP